MVDLSTDFLDGEQGRQRPLMALGVAIGKNALARYGLAVPTVYWRVNEELKGVVSPRAAPTPEARGKAPSEALRSSNVRRYERATAQELAAFEAAWQKGSELTVGERTYASDLAPLGGPEARNSG